MLFIVNIIIIINYDLFIVQKQHNFFQFTGPQRLGPLVPGLVGLAVNPPLNRIEQYTAVNETANTNSHVLSIAASY